ncbi:MAG: hypothetical protein UV60_C0004G0034 [Parcubacteria group bacterium GW2011_GWA2_43_11]|nr:MAG: hypothetical protein UU89_C0017G0035 [Parcubacteria group bacterium GW2011_GWC2_42_11]KKS85957.1 MAG: hypothetical protein UV60_C0004G0034 [Parcubacteria group bacterium GW2011_GWA2_43_11]
MSKLIAFLLIPECKSCKSCTYATDNPPEIFRKEFAEVRPWEEYTPHPNHRLVVWLGDGKNKKQLPDEEVKRMLGCAEGTVEYFWQCYVCRKIVSMEACPHDHSEDDLWNLDLCKCPDAWSFPEEVS